MNSKDVGGHSSCSLVSAIIWNSPATTAPSDDERPVKDRNASSDLEQHNRTVKDQKAVRTWVVLLVEDPTIRRTSAVLHDAYLYRFSSATVLWIAPRDDDRPERDESAELDLVQQDRTVEDQNAVNSRIVSRVDDSQRMTSSRATPMVGEASDPIPQ
ncbi:hypothetical protein QAD02_013775 [Eretmocerus hayati]|uniref:Uncharacterized protein n=2 Tax=Eretmocerus hayati TaxID=131215 RepID=A0ACC2P4F8_9HYME|nr:hypothetical protein QAD02_013440 [Eretmocerus hayati]KAJ8677988.1 hypothetical protein QAD02_013775 [Eretmocerus hayati]